MEIKKEQGELGVDKFHLDRQKGRNARTKCKCIRVPLRDPNIRWAVSRYLLAYFKKRKFEQDDVIINWFRYASNASNANQKHWCFLPYDFSPAPS